MPKGLLVDIMGTDCTNGGITSKQKMAILVLPNRAIGPVETEGSDFPVLTILQGRFGRLTIAVPADENGFPKYPNRNPMFGGHFIYSSDSRFSQISDQPVHVHDRFE